MPEYRNSETPAEEKGNMDQVLNIRYAKLNFELTFTEDCELLPFKSSALRGGMGEMLLNANCVRDRNCESCDFRKDCIVQRTMYSQFESKPAFVTGGESVGYVVNCENYEEYFSAGSTMTFTLTLFGSTIVYFAQYMQALFALGRVGLGKNKAEFFISNVFNSGGQPILQGNTVYMENYHIETVKDYVNRRMKQEAGIRSSYEMYFHTPLTQKYRGEFLKQFDMEAIIKSIQRRIYMLDAFEGFDSEAFYRQEYEAPVIQRQKVKPITVKRFSNRKQSTMPLNGIKGTIILDGVAEDTLKLLYAGELLHIGKNTSFGYGGFRIR